MSPIQKIEFPNISDRPREYRVEDGYHFMRTFKDKFTTWIMVYGPNPDSVIPGKHKLVAEIKESICNIYY